MPPAVTVTMKSTPMRRREATKKKERERTMRTETGKKLAPQPIAGRESENQLAFLSENPFQHGRRLELTAIPQRSARRTVLVFLLAAVGPNHRPHRSN